MPVGNSKAARASFPGSLAPGARQRSRPAIIRWITRKRLILQLEHDALAQPTETGHPAPLGFRHRRHHRSEHERVADGEVLQPLPENPGLQAGKVDLDVGELGHAASPARGVASGRRRTSPRSPRCPPRTRAPPAAAPAARPRAPARVEVDGDEVGPAAPPRSPGRHGQRASAAGGGGRQQRRRATSPSASGSAPRISPRSRWPYSSQRISSSSESRLLRVGADGEPAARGLRLRQRGMPSPRLPSVSGQRQTVPARGEEPLHVLVGGVGAVHGGEAPRVSPGRRASPPSGVRP